MNPEASSSAFEKPHKKKSSQCRVVFDIDECICWRQDSHRLLELPSILNKFPECRVIDVKVQGNTYPHIFAPQIEFLFDYLLEKGTLITFFSAGVEERNKPLIEAYFKNHLSPAIYEKHVQEGQFQVFSRQHLSEPRTPHKKDLKTIVTTLDEVENTILVEDDYSYVAENQAPCLKGRFVLSAFDKCMRDDSSESLALNHAYYFLGVLDTCFEQVDAQNVSLRKALSTVLALEQPDKEGNIFNEWPKFGDQPVQKFLKRGLEVIQRKNPEARLYAPNLYE